MSHLPLEQLLEGGFLHSQHSHGQPEWLSCWYLLKLQEMHIGRRGGSSRIHLFFLYTFFFFFSRSHSSGKYRLKRSTKWSEPLKSVLAACVFTFSHLSPTDCSQSITSKPYCMHFDLRMNFNSMADYWQKIWACSMLLSSLVLFWPLTDNFRTCLFEYVIVVFKLQYLFCNNFFCARCSVKK